MKNAFPFCAVVLLASLAWLPSSRAQESEAGRFYVHLDLGPSFAEDTGVTEFLGPAQGAEVEFETGVRLDLAGGYRVTDWFGVEMETGFASMFVDHISGVGSVDVNNSSFTTVPLLVNVVFQVPNPSRLVPFAGGGVGGALSMFYADDITNYNTFFVDGSDSDAVFAFQGFAGLRFQINDAMSAGLVYKYFYTDAASWGVEDDFDQPIGDIAFEEVKMHSVSAFFSVKF